ncbi:MAG: hypothetical protein ACRDRW_21010 [Pseudonocardiaceae bacterium]
MDRCAVLVDADYLYAEGGKLCCRTPARARSALQPSLAVELLHKVALETTQLPDYRDLITLAQHRAISDAVLLSGDEDLREGVRAAQDYGPPRRSQ